MHGSVKGCFLAAGDSVMMSLAETGTGGGALKPIDATAESRYFSTEA